MDMLIRFMYCIQHNYNDVEILEVPQDEAQIYLLEGLLINCNYIHFSGN
jgi:hypothetical protein